jgi:hypothetical protein
VDTYDLAEPAQDLTLCLLTPCEADLAIPGRVILRETPLADGRLSGSAQIDYPPKLTASAEAIVLQDDRLRGIWGQRLTRITLRAENPPQRDTWTLQIRA